MSKVVRTLVVGCGNMGSSHAASYHDSPDFEIVGLVSFGDSKVRLNKQLNADYPLFDSFQAALEKNKPDPVCVYTYPDTHADYAIAAVEAGENDSVEKWCP